MLEDLIVQDCFELFFFLLFVCRFEVFALEELNRVTAIWGYQWLSRDSWGWFNLIVARRATTRVVFSLHPYCCHLCEIQGIPWEFCLRGMMAHCQTTLHPESPRGIAWRIPVWMRIIVTVHVVSGRSCHSSNLITYKNGWVNHGYAVMFFYVPQQG